MRNKKKLWTALHFLMITVGTFVYSVALEMFLVPNLVLDGGLTGISLMINYQTGILLGLLTFLLNIPFVVLGWRMLGLRFAGSYLYAMILLSGFTALFHDVAPVTDNELLSVVFGGKAAQPETTLNDERLLLRSTIFAAVNKMYLDCCFDALRQEQALWSDILPDLA